MSPPDTALVTERCVKYNLYVGSFENKRCDQIKIRLCITRKKCLYFNSVNSRNIIFLSLLRRSKNKISQVHLGKIKLSSLVLSS